MFKFEEDCPFELFKTKWMPILGEEHLYAVVNLFDGVLCWDEADRIAIQYVREQGILT